jgi:sulfate adenylyltransferase subunit 2
VNKGESIRVFPLSNWTELDVWLYVHRENLPMVPLYFAKERPVVKRNGTWIMVDDERMPLEPGEKPEMRKVRFRTLGCYPLTGADRVARPTPAEDHRGDAAQRDSERQGRVIDYDEAVRWSRRRRRATSDEHGKNSTASASTVPGPLRLPAQDCCGS